MVIELTDKNFGAAVKKHLLVLVDFWAEWCYPCRMLSPVVEELAEEYDGKIVFAKLNVSENQRTAMQYQVTSIPMLVLFKDGKAVDTITGAVPKVHIEAMLKRHTAK